MSANPSELAWQMLERVPLQEITTRSSGVSVDGGLILHSIDSGGNRHLLIPITESSIDFEDTKSRGVTVSSRTLNVPGVGDQRFIDVKCEESALKDLFSKVCDEIIEHCEMTPSSPALSVNVVLERWRELLGPPGRRLLTEQQLKGLLAELHVLEAVAAVSPSRAVKLWTGVDRNRHDFTGLRTACEVKASSLVDEVKIHVNGLTQLTCPPGSSLYLVIERFERVPVGGDSLPNALHRLEHAGVERHALLTALMKVGVQASDLESYATVRFSSLERRIYNVDSNFPRLTAELLVGTPSADRISSVEYVLNLGAQPPTPLGDDLLSRLPQLLLDESEEPQ